MHRSYLAKSQVSQLEAGRFEVWSPYESSALVTAMITTNYRRAVEVIHIQVYMMTPISISHL